MRTMLLSLATALAVLLPQCAAADEPKKPGPPDPEMLFKHLDANHDGVIAEDEIPAGAPMPLKMLLRIADKKGDKKVTLDEFRAAVKEFPLPGPPFGPPGPHPGGNAMFGFFGGPMPGGMPGGPGGMQPPFAPGAPAMGFGPHGPNGPPHGGPRGPMPDPKELFEKMDKDKDGKLSVEEFTEGMKRVHEAIKGHFHPMGPMPGFGMPMPPPGPMPGGMMMPPQGPGPMMQGPMVWTQNGGSCPPGGPCPMMKPGDGKVLEARLKDLEAKLKALEAKIDAKEPKKVP